MKKLSVLVFAALLVVAFSVPVSAEVEHIFGGYWRTRFYTQQDFTGNDQLEVNDTRDGAQAAVAAYDAATLAIMRGVFQRADAFIAGSEMEMRHNKGFAFTSIFDELVSEEGGITSAQVFAQVDDAENIAEMLANGGATTNMIQNIGGWVAGDYALFNAAFGSAASNPEQVAAVLAAAVNAALPEGVLTVTAPGSSTIGDLSQVDTRARLYYTAKLNDNLKLVTKFEMDAVWGDSGWGDLGADGVSIEIKNVYAEWTMGSWMFRVGIQPWVLARGFAIDNDAAGILALGDFGLPWWKVAFAWIRVFEGYDHLGMGKNHNQADMDAYLFKNIFFLGSQKYQVAPWYVYLHAQDGSELDFLGFDNLIDNVNVHMIGLSVDLDFDFLSLWFEGIYQFGDVTLDYQSDVVEFLAWAEVLTGRVIEKDYDVDGYLLAMGFEVPFPVGNVHGEVFYATGEDHGGAMAGGLRDNEIDMFLGLPGFTSHYWAEIMGLGIFDTQASAGSCADVISNILAANIGVTFKNFIPNINNHSVTFDLWYAQLAQNRNHNLIANNQFEGGKVLGWETDLKISYELVEGLTLDVVGAYLFAGDATRPYSQADWRHGSADANPYEIGTRLSLSF
jgi:hypothetical protein